MDFEARSVAALRPSSATNRGFTTRRTRCSGPTRPLWSSPTRKNGRERRWWKSVRSLISGCGGDIRLEPWIRGSKRCTRLSIHTTRCMFTSSTIRELLGWRCASSARSAHEDRDADDGDHDHHQRCELRLAQAVDDGGVRAEVAEPESAQGIQAQVDQTQYTVRKPGLQALVEWK